MVFSHRENELNSKVIKQSNHETIKIMSGTRQRIITGLIFGAIVIGGMLAHQWSFQVVFVLIAALCLWEFFGMTLETEPKAWAMYRKILGTGLGLLPILVAL